MQHFVYGLNPKSEHFLNLASEGSVMYKTVSEAKTILEKVLNSTPLTILLSQQIPPPKGSHSTSFLLFPPPPHIEKITEPPKSSDHEPLLEDMPMVVPDLFLEEEYIELGHVSNMPKEHK